MPEPTYGTPEWDVYVQNERNFLEVEVGQVWNTDELQQDYIVESFFAPFVFVTRRSDNQKGSMLFQHSPRFYHSFKPSL